MNCNTTHYRANSSSVPGDPTWHRAARNAVFRAVQDQVVDDLYFNPAVRRWREVGATLPLTLAAIYDTNIQHGEGDDPDGLPAIMERATILAGGTPADGIAESAWLTAFLKERYRTLSNPVNTATRKGWRESRDRVRVFQKLQAEQNFNLEGPFSYVVYTDPFTIE